LPNWVLRPAAPPHRASPIDPGSDGTRTFFSDQSMVIHQNLGPEPAALSNPELR
jgi:hypothetical protein